jgi:hypothetical protein
MKIGQSGIKVNPSLWKSELLNTTKIRWEMPTLQFTTIHNGNKTKIKAI